MHPVTPASTHGRLSDFFGVDAFTEDAMRRYLPTSTFLALRRVVRDGGTLDPALADVVAGAMKQWAVERGATHYCHWFQPLSGRTAEKHEAFLGAPADGRALMEFDGKALCRSEPDASSFPSAGLRTTFEARGYTAWDCTSPVFVRACGDNVTLFIPSAFCAYTADAMDKKTPLLRSIAAVDAATRRVLAWFAKHFPAEAAAAQLAGVQRVTPTLGVEQEYFLVERRHADARPDLRLVGRTLAGAPAPKGQDLKDQYYGPVSPRIGSFMHEVNVALWKLGIASKTQHNEVAPGQYELACLYTGANQATDWNQVVMAVLQETAPRHDFVCLLHEKPFSGVNGSGKHCNWSLATDAGRNLLSPGRTPFDRIVFLTFVTAVVAAVDRYPHALMATVATAGNDHRLGGLEAPPSILSVYLGDAVAPCLERFAAGDFSDLGPGEKTAKGKTAKAGKGAAGDSCRLRLGVSSLPPLPRDDTDRNRTSPFAFTGDKFEFRSPGSSQSVADPAMVINTIVADTLEALGDALDGLPEGACAADHLHALLGDHARRHGRVVFNGDNYSAGWIAEAARRGLAGAAGAVDTIVAASRGDQTAPFLRRGVLSKTEIEYRREIQLGLYRKTWLVEARTLLDIGRRRLLPAGMAYLGHLAETRERIRRAELDSMAVADQLSRVSGFCDALAQKLDALDAVLANAGDVSIIVAAPVDAAERTPTDRARRAVAVHDHVGAAMRDVRAAADALERFVDAAAWPLPTYTDMLFER